MATTTQPRFPADQANGNGKPKTAIVLDDSTPLEIAAKQVQEGNVDLGLYVDWLKKDARGSFADVAMSACRVLSDTDLRDVLKFREARAGKQAPAAAPEFAWSVSSGGHATLTVKGSKGGSNTTTMSVASWRGFFAYIGAPEENPFEQWLAGSPEREFPFEHYKKSRYQSTQRLFDAFCKGTHAHHVYLDLGANIVRMFLDLGKDKPTVPEDLRARPKQPAPAAAANPLANLTAEQVQALLAQVGK